MVHAQIECGRFETQAHGQYPDEPAVMQEYLRRDSLNRNYAGDVYAAICSFGLCLPNLPHKSVEIAVNEVTDIGSVLRKVIKGCRVQFDAERDAQLYDPTCGTRLKTEVDPHSGVISTRLTAGGAHFHNCNKAIGDERARMNEAVREVNRAYCQPLGADPGGSVLTPFALDGQDRVYILDQDHIEVPVLEYGEQGTCVDYTPDAIIKGIMVIDNAQGAPRKCTTRDLYQLPNPENIYCDNRHPFQARHTRRIQGTPFEEPLGTEKGTEVSLRHLQIWLGTSTALLQNLLFLPQNCPAHGAVTMQTPHTTDSAFGFNCADKSMLGGPLPIKLMKSRWLLGETDPGGAPRLDPDHPLAATARVAPLISYDGVNYQARFDHDGPVDVDALAERMSRMGHRNIIGVAMQRIKTNTQGDLMLHDGV
jgi:hypothetical protein